jgi:hypothetical protein
MFSRRRHGPELEVSIMHLEVFFSRLDREGRRRR